MGVDEELQKNIEWGIKTPWRRSLILRSQRISPAGNRSQVTRVIRSRNSALTHSLTRSLTQLDRMLPGSIAIGRNKVQELGRTSLNKVYVDTDSSIAR